MKQKSVLIVAAILMLLTTIGTGIVYADTLRFTGTVGAVHRVHISEGTEITVEFNCLEGGLIAGLPGIAGALPLPLTPDNQLLDFITVTDYDFELASCGLRGYYTFIAPMTGEYQFLVIEAGFGHYELIIRGADIEDLGSSDPNVWRPDDRLNPDMAAGVAVYVENNVLQVYRLNDEGRSYLALNIPFSEIVCEPVPAPAVQTITNQAGTISATCLSNGEIQVSVTEGASGTLNFSPSDFTCQPTAPTYSEIAASEDGQTHLYCLDTGELQLNLKKGHEELVYVWNQMPPTHQTTYVFNALTGERLSYNTQEIGQ